MNDLHCRLEGDLLDLLLLVMMLLLLLLLSGFHELQLDEIVNVVLFFVVFERLLVLHLVGHLFHMADIGFDHFRVLDIGIVRLHTNRVDRGGWRWRCGNRNDGAIVANSAFDDGAR